MSEPSNPSLTRRSSSSIRPQRPTRSLPPAPLELSTVGPAPVIDRPVSSSPLSEVPSAESNSDLTKIRAHYLKKSLIQLQFNRELDAITTAPPTNISTFSYLGPPFSPPPKDAPILALPFLRYIFRQFVLTFPFMAAAPKDFYSDKLQPFMASILSRNLSPTSVFDENPEHSEQATRIKLMMKLERNLSMFMSAAVKITEPEEVVRLTQIDLDRLEELGRKRREKMMKGKDIFEVNIVSVRTVIDKGRVRSRAHEEFIIRTRRSHYPDCYVSRRYGDFKTLFNELRRSHPQEDIRQPPAKDRSTVNIPQSMSSQSSEFSPTDDWQEDDDLQTSPNSQNNFVPSRLAREKNRLTLRAYLHSLMSSSAIASSPVLKSFLLSSPTTLSTDEQHDVMRREDADKMRDDGRKRFAREIASRVDGLREAVKSVKGDIMGKDGLTRVFSTIKVTPNVKDLPPNYRAVVEWARISLASTIFQQYVASDNASESFAGLKRLHGLMPYFMMKTALKISNPIGMIRAILDLFMAQPFGGRSLLQRMFTVSLSEEVRTLEAEIAAVMAKVEDPVICEKIRLYVFAPKEIQNMFQADAAADSLHILTVVLRSGDEPVLSRAQMHRVVKAHKAHAIYMRYRASLVDSDDDDGPQNEDAWLYEDLKVLGNLYSRLRDRQQLIELIFEGSTADLLKDIITIFYTPLAQVYRAASIGDSLSDMQSFINDLIRTVEQTEELSQEDPHSTVQAFIDLVERHEQSFYEFVYKVHSKGEGLFDSLMRWMEIFLTVIREGLLEPISLEFLLPHTGKERTDILEEVDKVALYHYKLKVLYEDKLRKRFRHANQNEADAEDENTQALVESVLGEINFGELVQGDANDLAAEETDSDEDSESSEYETDSDDGDEESGEESSGADSSVERTPRQQFTVAPIVASSPPPSRTQNPHQSSQSPTVGSRPRTLSLRSMRSMTFRAHPSSSSSPAQSSTDIPPVPLLPMNNQLAIAISKPLPPSPSRSSISSSRSHMSSSSSIGRLSMDNLAPPPPPPKTPLRQSPLGPNPSKPPKKAKASQTLKPPDLRHIPKLLPIFSEMMRPLLRPRQRTT